MGVREYGSRLLSSASGNLGRSNQVRVLLASTALAILAGLLVVGCDGNFQESSAASSALTESRTLRALPRYERVVPLITTEGKLFSNLYYEANNVLMRGTRS
jgi:hypothetical protein